MNGSNSLARSSSLYVSYFSKISMRARMDLAEEPSSQNVVWNKTSSRETTGS